jgi:hypothetical protein
MMIDEQSAKMVDLISKQSWFTALAPSNKAWWFTIAFGVVVVAFSFQARCRRLRSPSARHSDKSDGKPADSVESKQAESAGKLDVGDNNRTNEVKSRAALDDSAADNRCEADIGDSDVKATVQAPPETTVEVPTAPKAQITGIPSPPVAEKVRVCLRACFPVCFFQNTSHRFVHERCTD